MEEPVATTLRVRAGERLAACGDPSPVQWWYSWRATSAASKAIRRHNPNMLGSCLRRPLDIMLGQLVCEVRGHAKGRSSTTKTIGKDSSNGSIRSSDYAEHYSRTTGVVAQGNHS